MTKQTTNQLVRLSNLTRVTKQRTKVVRVRLESLTDKNCNWVWLRDMCRGGISGD